MPGRRRSEPEPPQSSLRRAKTPEGREHQLISLATDLAETQLREGKASAQVISHYLKLGSTREILEQERLARENKLLEAKVEALESQKRIEELYQEALDAMRSYAGQEPNERFDEFED